MHEAKTHEHNAFVTLTYNDENVPAYGTLVKRHITLFLKRLRKALGNKRIRFYMCGEYGELNRRPHYHLCIFGIDIPDKSYYKTVMGNKLYTSELITRLWPYGFNTIGDLNFQTAAYTARYVMKKINGAPKKKHYERIDSDTGEIIDIEPEYNNMSRMPGIGRDWLDRFWTDVYPHGYVILKAQKTNPPRYYDKQLELREPLQHAELKRIRKIQQIHQWKDNTSARLKVKDAVAAAQIRMLKRTI